MHDDQDDLSTITLSLPSDILNRLQISSERTGSSPGSVIEKVLRQFLFDTSKNNAVYLSAPISALVEGLYVENTTMTEIKQHGDFGLGTFNFLDGEMVILDGDVYQIKSDGSVHRVKDDDKSPFACVTFFNPDTIEDIENSDNSKGFYAFLNTLIPSENMLYAIRIDGTFNNIRIRVVPRSENYRPLVEATKNQPVFDFYDVRGCLAGFYTPRFMESLNAPGYHMHFLSEDRRHGGHLIECIPGQVRIGIQHVPKLDVGLPKTLDYLTADLTRNVGKDLDKAEH
ncbi:MAG: acetolactate decarboxylase [Syntrophorhabdaceae bacterium]